MSGPRKGASAAAIRRLPADDDFVAEPRTQLMHSIAVVQDPEVLSALEAVFQGTSVMSDQRKATTLVRVRNEVHIEWARARQSFVAIGKALLAAEDALSPEEFRQLSKNTGRVFPFSETTATQLRQVARAVVSGRLAEDEMPGSYSVAYQIALMDPSTIEIARSRHLVRPDVTRTELIAFRREVNTTVNPDRPRSKGRPVESERARLQRLRTELALKIAEIDSRLAELPPVGEGS
jgi:hypothetical protein